MDFFPKTHNLSLTMRKTSDNAQSIDILQGPWRPVLRKIVKVN